MVSNWGEDGYMERLDIGPKWLATSNTLAYLRRRLCELRLATSNFSFIMPQNSIGVSEQNSPFHCDNILLG